MNACYAWPLGTQIFTKFEQKTLAKEANSDPSFRRDKKEESNPDTSLNRIRIPIATKKI
jgi:hypothetical protein